MNNNDAKSRPGPQEQADPLSATGMFLRAFDASPESAPPSDPFAKSTEAAAGSGSGSNRNDRPAAASKPSSAPGEFTQMFNSAEPRRPAAPASVQAPVSQAREMPAQSAPSHATAAFKGSQQPVADQAPGEFTRIFVAGPTPTPAAPQAPSAAAASRNFEDAPRTMPMGSPARGKGFSSPGVSDAASADGSFTQFFKAASPAPAARPVQSAPPPSPLPPPPPPRPQPVQETPWKDDPIFRAHDHPPQHPSPSVTSLLSSLGAPDRPSAGSRQPEPAAYRAEPTPAFPPASRPAEPSGPEAGGVTRMIQRLAQEPPTAAAPPPPQAPIHSGPGEFTRMMSSLAAQPATREPAAPAAAPPAPAGAVFAPPPMPHVPAPPAAPAAPKMTPPAPMAAPAIHAPALPPVPKPAAPALPAIAAPKGKLESMVPILLVINTFLLLVLLMVVIFLIKSK